MTREEAIKVLKKYKRYAESILTNEVLDSIAFDMAIEALSRPQGEWKAVTEMFDTLDGIKTYMTGMRCSKCSHMFDVRGYNYCPNCGAKMHREDGDTE